MHFSGAASAPTCCLSLLASVSATSVSGCATSGGGVGFTLALLPV
jgi:hypothetical protein